MNTYGDSDSPSRYCENNREGLIETLMVGHLFTVSILIEAVSNMYTSQETLGGIIRGKLDSITPCNEIT